MLAKVTDGSASAALKGFSNALNRVHDPMKKTRSSLSLEKFDQDQRIYFFADESVPVVNEAQLNELKPNLPSPLKRSKLKKTKRRPKSKGKRRTTQRAKPARANQTRILEEEVENLGNAANNAYADASTEDLNKNMYKYYFKGKKPQGLTLGNFI
jgi:hypothetical protein